MAHNCSTDETTTGRQTGDADEATTGLQTRNDGPGTVRVRHQWGDGDLCGTIVDAIAGTAGTTATGMPPLYDAVDPDALERLFRRFDGVREESALRVSFEHAGHAVTVTAAGDVLVHRVDDGPGIDPSVGGGRRPRRDE